MFEDFCWELFQAEWGDPQAQRYGRPGALPRLGRSLATRGRDVEQMIASLRRLHAKMAHLPPIDDEWIARVKAEGRL